jgi:hypothetical protein
VAFEDDGGSCVIQRSPSRSRGPRRSTPRRTRSARSFRGTASRSPSPGPARSLRGATGSSRT